MTNRSKAVMWIVGVFLTGSLFGGGLVALLRQPPAPPPPQDPLGLEEEAPSPPPQQGPAEESDQRGSLQPPPDGHRGNGRRDRHRGPNMRAEVRLLARHLNLDEEQRAQLVQIVRQGNQRLMSMDREMRERRSQIRKDMGHSIRSILTPEQKELFDDYIANRRQRMRQFQQRFRDRLDKRPDQDR
ncbi:MAG TPA: hypothetical protein VLU25_09680 [Acidobacteriota bacterium]|nr:hypothetical protein [Acidobacteriota bacterium]